MTSTEDKSKKRQIVETVPQTVEVFDNESIDKYVDKQQKIPLITLLSSIDATNKMNSTELRLRRWFKCTKFDEKCFATRNSCQQFLSHLADKHPEEKLFCLYCNPIIGTDDKQYFPHEDLVEHIRSKHSYRKYQCNLCLFRSISVDHILIHQQSVHSRNFEATLLKAESNDAQDLSLKPIQQSVKECKVIECTALAETPLPDEGFYFQNHRHKRINAELMAHQCLYCPYLDTNKEELYAHCVAAHPDYPILIYTGISPKHSVNGHKEDNEIAKDVKSAKKRSFDESFSDSDVTTNGVVDTYEFERWTESEDEDMFLSEDDLSFNGVTEETVEPASKRQKTEELADSLKKDNKSMANRLQQTRYYLAAGVSALLAVYLSVVVMSGR